MDSRSATTISRRERLAPVARALYALGAIAVLALIAVWTNAILERTFHTDQCLWEVMERDGENALVVTEVPAGGRADRAGVQEGDQVLAINGVDIQPAEESRMLTESQEILNASPTEEPISYVVNRDGLIIDLTIRLTESKSTPILPVLYAVFAALWLIIGLIVGLTRPLGRIQLLFFLTGLSVFFSFSGPLGLFQTMEWMVVWLLAGTLFFFSWIEFCASFPVRQTVLEGNRRWILYLLYLFPLAGSITLVTGSGPSGFLAELSYFALKVIGGIFYGIGVWLLFRGYDRMSKRSDRRPMRVILVGTVITSVVLLYFTFVNVLQWEIGSSWALLLLVPTPFLLALPLSFGYAIFRYQLMDVRSVVKTALVYTLTTGAIVGLYISIALVLGRQLGSLLGEDMQRVVEIVILGLFLFLFEPLRRIVQRFFDRRFFPQYYDYSDHLTRFGHAVTEAIGVRHVADVVRNTLQEGLSLEHVCVVTLEPNDENDQTTFVPVDGGCESGLDPNDPALRDLFETLTDAHEIVRLGSIRQGAFNRIIGTGLLFAVGLYSGGRLVGAVLLGERKDGRPISGSQLTFIRSVAAQAASGIEAARLYENELERQRYEEELATARRIQESLLPARMPDIEGVSFAAVSEPALEVGGDYYDVIQLTDSTFIALIADVSGKGLPAALYMAELHGMVRIASALGKSPREVLMLLNDRLSDIVARTVFVTASVLLIDVEGNSIRFARAGHTRLIRVRNRTPECFAPRGLPLGIRTQGLFEEKLCEEMIDFRPGDLILLYSDGLTEAMNARREEFGEQRLLETLKAMSSTDPEYVTGQLVQRADQHRDGAARNDDLTIVAIRHSAANQM